MATRRRSPAMDESDSEGNEDWTPSDMDLKPSSRDAGRLMGRPEPARSRRAPEPAARPDRPIRLTVKPPSRLREVVNEDDEDDEEPAPASRTPLSRSTKQNKPPVMERHPSSSSSSATNDDDSEEEEDEEDIEEDDDDAEADDGSDVDMTETTPAPAPLPPVQPSTAKPKIKLNHPYSAAPHKPTPDQALKLGGSIQSVEEKEISMGGTGNSDDELSPAESQADAEGDEDDEDMDAEGDDDDDAIRASQIREDELGSESELDSRDGTPDPSKLTRRQRRTSPTGLLALSNEAQKKKFFTAEEVSMRRAEMARRRKDLSEKRNEQEKLDTLDRLLHKRAPVRRSRKEMEAEREREEFGTPGMGGESGDEGGPRARPLYVRTVISAKGTRVGVPDEWEGKAIGRVFDGARRTDNALKIVSGSRMVQVVE